MKKNFLRNAICVAMVSMMVIPFVGCGKDTTSQNTTENYGKIDWPESDLVNQIPKPESDRGEIFEESSSFFSVDVANTTLADYKEYVKKCQKAGFTVDYSKSDTTFWADNKDGYRIEVDFEEDLEEDKKDVMEIIISAPDKEETTISEPKETKPKATKPKATKPKTTEPKSSGVSADFKETMDSYESFMNEYVDFMKKYNESDDTMSMLTDYTDMLGKYSDYVSKIDSINQDELSADDLAYYLEVTSRVTKKLATIS